MARPASTPNHHPTPERGEPLYLAGIRDLFHRGIVGWDTSGRQDTNVATLEMALARTGKPAEVIHHADKGSIYTSLDFAFAAGNYDMSLSFGSIGDAYVDAAMCHAYLFVFIEVFYNRHRHQGGLRHLTPTEYADKWRHDHGQPNPS